MLSGKATLEIKAKKNAPSPKADSGNAVAVPLWVGQFKAAGADKPMWQPMEEKAYIHVLIEPEKADAPPMPVRKAKKHSQGRAIDPGPLSKAAEALDRGIYMCSLTHPYALQNIQIP